MASMTRSQSLRSSSWVEPLRRPSVSSLARSSILALATSPSRLLRTPPSPLSRKAWFASITTVGKPACAETCAMPEPMSPQPITPTCLMAMRKRPPQDELRILTRSGGGLLAAAGQRPQGHHLVLDITGRARVPDGHRDRRRGAAASDRGLGHHLSLVETHGPGLDRIGSKHFP